MGCRVRIILSHSPFTGTVGNVVARDGNHPQFWRVRLDDYTVDTWWSTSNLIIISPLEQLAEAADV